MSVVAYFIGGPLDLTKRVLPQGDCRTVTSVEPHDRQVDHKYYARGPVDVFGSHDRRQHVIFVYQGAYPHA